ncbi:MAG: hypothetical protein P4M11_06845 [Candidatus Pacebacteria bacterium]|nr:hypothetical protein [Candidatus Paceibacterota bacterium]
MRRGIDFRKCRDRQLLGLVCKTIWRHVQEADSCREYSKFLVTLVFYRTLADEAKLDELPPEYFALLHKVLDVVCS